MLVWVGPCRDYRFDGSRVRIARVGLGWSRAGTRASPCPVRATTVRGLPRPSRRSRAREDLVLWSRTRRLDGGGAPRGRRSPVDLHGEDCSENPPRCWSFAVQITSGASGPGVGRSFSWRIPSMARSGSGKSQVSHKCEIPVPAALSIEVLRPEKHRFVSPPRHYPKVQRAEEG